MTSTGERESYKLDAKSLEFLRGWLVGEDEELYEDWFYLHSQEVDLDVWLSREHPDIFDKWVAEVF